MYFFNLILYLNVCDFFLGDYLLVFELCVKILFFWLFEKYCFKLFFMFLIFLCLCDWIIFNFMVCCSEYFILKLQYFCV